MEDNIFDKVQEVDLDFRILAKTFLAVIKKEGSI